LEKMKDYETKTDEQLILELRQGNSEIMDFLMVKYKAMVRKKARTMYLLGGENEDLIQEGMIGLIQAVRDYEPSRGNSFSGFAKMCVARQMYTAIEASNRKKHLPLNSYISLYGEEAENEERKPPLIDTIGSQEDNDPETLYFGKENTEAFMKELKSQLSTLEKQVLHLHLQGIAYRRIAEALDKSPKAIDNALHRCKTKAGNLRGKLL